jgi:hypothetical protein
MPEIIGDAALYQNPLDAAAKGYAMTPPAEGAGGAMGAELGSTPALGYGTRAVERGAGAPDASWFSKYMAGLVAANSGMALEPPPSSPTLEPAEYNRLYAPEGASLGDKPMSESLAKILGKEKYDQLRRESVLARYNAENPVKGFATETLASFADPLNLSTLVLPGIAGEALAARLGGGILARTGARAITGAATGAIQQAPLSALRYGLSQDEFADYSLHDAFRDIAFGAAGAAVINAGVVGGVSEFLRWRRGAVALPAGVNSTLAESAAPIIGADAATDRAAMRATVGAIYDGRPVDAEGFFYQPPQAATAIGLATRPADRAAIATEATVEAQARRIAPQAFAEYDPLAARAQELRGQLADPEGTIGRDLDQRIDAARQRTAAAQQYPVGLPPEELRQAIAAHTAEHDEATRALAELQTDRPTLIAAATEQARQEFAAIELKMRDLAPAVSAATRQAENIFGAAGANRAVEMGARPALPDAAALAAAADRQRLLYRDGYAPGISQAELSRSVGEIYHPAPASEATAGEGAGGATRAPESGTATPARAERPGEATAVHDPELAEAEAAAAGIDHAELMPEERAQLEASAQGMTEAQEIAAGMAEAAACIVGGTVGSA